MVDEVSQYVLGHKDRVDRLRAFTSALGAGLKGRCWLLALGQQKLDEGADDSFLVWAKDRFPQKLRVHLATTNIRDVVHKRLLLKQPAAEALLREHFTAHRADLKLYAYGCDALTPDEFVETYPLLPGHIDLLLRITTALRTRSSRAQGDDQAIRGLLQLLGELFREQKLAEQPVGALITLDQIYEVQHTALDSDVQASMGRILAECANDATGLRVRVAKAVALLELIQETDPTDARLVAQCLYDRVDRGNQVQAITDALEALRRQNLLGYSEKTGYKIQSTAGEEWERDRRDLGVTRETIVEHVRDTLRWLMELPETPTLKGRRFAWAATLSDGRRLDDAPVLDRRDDAVVRVDFRFLAKDERTESTWVKRSAEAALHDRLVWVCGETDAVEHDAREYARSKQMVRKYEPRQESLSGARKLLLQQERNREEDLERRLRDAVAAAWLAGRVYFRGGTWTPADHGAAFASALGALGNRLLPDLFPHYVGTTVDPSELKQLLAPELSGPSPKFLDGDLGLLELDGGRYVPSCAGVVPRRVHELIEREGGVGGTTLIAQFGGPPYGYHPNVVKACVAGLLRASKIRVQPDGGGEITAIRDAGVRDLFEKDRDFRRASYFPAGEDDIGYTARAQICKFFAEVLDTPLDREDHLIADAVSQRFPQQARRLRDVLARHDALPGARKAPEALEKLHEVLEQCVAKARQTKPTVQLVKQRLDALRDGLRLLAIYDAELTNDAITQVKRASNLIAHHTAQLRAVDALPADVADAAARVAAQLDSERPWREIGALEADFEAIQAAYVAERQRLLAWQEAQGEAARGRVKTRQGFATLTGEQSHKVLAPINGAGTATSADALAPALVALKESFQLALRRAEEEANERLDGLLSEGDKPLIRKVDLGLRHRELQSEADVDALVEEIRERLLAQVRAGVRVRLV